MSLFTASTTETGAAQPVSDGGLRSLARSYTREKAVVEDILELRSLPRAEFWRRLNILDYQQSGCPRQESLVYWLRVFQVEKEFDSAWQVATILIDRVKRKVTRRLNCWRRLTADQREEIESSLSLVLFEEWFSLEPGAEFWEIRFSVCLERTISDEIDKLNRVYQHETQLTPINDGEGNESSPWELIAEEPVLDMETAALVQDALSHLDEPLRTTVRMYHYLGLSEEQIAQHWNCTTRTVRNYLRRARERLETWRALEA